MRVLLLNPSFNRYAGIKGHGGLSAPLNIAYLAAYLRLKRSDAEIKILDAEAHGLTFEQTVEEVIAFAPGVVGITTTTPSFGVITKLVSMLHESAADIPLILGGPHATACPAECAVLPGIKAVVLGEGEETFLDIFDALARTASLDRIAGICFKHNAEVTFTDTRAPIDNLDILPFPARDLLPISLYYSPPTKSLTAERSANIITSRGCPFSCTYCLSQMMWGKRCRYRSPENIVAEIEHVIRHYDIHEFNFNDDLFTANKLRLRRFCELLIEGKFNIKWVCMSRADYIEPSCLAMMKKAGCGKIAMGLESGSEKVLKMMNKQLSIPQSIEAVRAIKAAGINVGASFVIGHIGETPSTIEETIALAKKCNPDTVAFFQASPYPGTEFYRQAKEAGYLRRDICWEDFAIVSDRRSAVDLPGLPADEIHCWIARAYRSFYLRPSYILSQLSRVRSAHEIKNLLRGILILVRIMGAEVRRKLQWPKGSDV